MEVDYLDQIQNGIVWIHDPKRFFTTYPKSKFATLSAAVLFFLRDTVDVVGRFYGNEWKIILF